MIGQVNRRENSNEFAPKLPTVSRRRYCYNPRNQLVRIDDQGHGTSLYQYDLLDRLRTVEGPTPEAFLFDPASNLLEALDGQEATDAQASHALPEPSSPNARRPQQTPGNRLKRQGMRRFTYDERGNRTEEIVERGPRQGQVTRYSYNAQNQLVEVNVGGVVTRYAYDALGRRISKTTEHGAQQNSTVSTTTFYWNGDVLLGELNNEVNSHSERPSRTYLFEPFSFKPLALVQNNEVFHYHTDHIGTPREITNARAQVVWSASFKTYGALALAHVNEVDNPLRFQGQYFDCETGLHYNRHRYYDPECGQFTTQDPIGLLGGMNAYQYAPNPVTWVDPWGLSCKELKTQGIKDVETPYGPAVQSDAPEALAARAEVENGATLYRTGTLGKSQAAEAQFWALENPNSTGYAQRYGIPQENIENANFIETAVLKPGAPFITRPAPGIGENIGGGIEVVVPENGVNMRYFGTK